MIGLTSENTVFITKLFTVQNYKLYVIQYMKKIYLNFALDIFFFYLKMNIQSALKNLEIYLSVPETYLK